MNKVIFALALAACTSSGSSGDDPNQVGDSLGQTNGALDTADEAPMFGDEAGFQATAIEDDASVSDPLTNDPDVAALASSPTLDSRRVLVMWGRMPIDPTAVGGRDWTGQLAVSRGVVLVQHTVGFELATDRILPRQDRQTVSFQSATRPFSDGVVLRVLADGTSADPLTLTYTSAIDATVTYTFDLAQLASGPISIDAGDGNQMIAIALRDQPACAHGFMRGRWRQLLPRLGIYRGIVHDEAGTAIGHVRGIYGERATGEKVMFGKFIDRAGTFVGLIGGTYNNGEFRAKWIDRAGDHGTLHGRYTEAADLRAGGFVARYAEAACSED